MGTERRCVELTAVYDDGTVERWDGQDLGGCLAPLRVYDKAKTHTEMTEDGEPYDRAETVLPTITKPLRKVTVVRGPYVGPDMDSGACIVEPPDAKSLEGHYHDLAEIIPDGVEDGQFHAVHERPMYDFRITVEAVPVEDKR